MKIEKPVRSRQAAVIDLAADPDRVFALMCPVREHEWVEGWRTDMIWSETGFVEDGCIFTTSGSDGAQAVWVTTDHDAPSRRLRMVKVDPGQTVTRLEIAVAAREMSVGGAAVTVSYELTALSPSGRVAVEMHTAASFAARMNESWKPALERQLRARPPMS